MNNFLFYIKNEMLKPYFILKIVFGKHFGRALVKCIIDGKYGTVYYYGLINNINQGIHILLLDDYYDYYTKKQEI